MSLIHFHYYSSPAKNPNNREGAKNQAFVDERRMSVVYTHTRFIVMIERNMVSLAWVVFLLVELVDA